MILDLNKKEDIYLINMYKKCKGIALIYKYLPHLNPLNKMYVINSLEDWKKVEYEFPVQTMTVRCDSPRGLDARLPGGQTFHRSKVDNYIKKVKSAVPDAVIILEDMKQDTNERIHTQGGLNLDIKIGSNVYIDYVGPGFDCGELCKGKAAHEVWNIPWDEVPFIKDSAMEKFKVFKINQKEYTETMKKRIDFLLNIYPDRKEEIFKAIPKNFIGITKNIFKNVIDELLICLWLQQEELINDKLNSFGVETNILKNERIIPMEIAIPDRFV